MHNPTFFTLSMQNLYRTTDPVIKAKLLLESKIAQMGKFFFFACVMLSCKVETVKLSTGRHSFLFCSAVLRNFGFQSWFQKKNLLHRIPRWIARLIPIENEDYAHMHYSCNGTSFVDSLLWWDYYTKLSLSENLNQVHTIVILISTRVSLFQASFMLITAPKIFLSLLWEKGDVIN